MNFLARYFDPMQHIGKKIDMLTIDKYLSTDKSGYYVYLCKCDCGREQIRTSRYLNSKKYPFKHCGCQTHPELINETFNKLTVLDFQGIAKSNGEHQYLCECECGNKITVFYTNLVSGHTKSCGCLKNKNIMTTNKYVKPTITAKDRMRLSSILNGMRQRCYNKNNKRYSVYGNRGISICNEWLDKKEGYVNFINWALNNGYKDNFSIERRNVNGNYEPNNCCWIPLKDQVWNKQNSLKLNDTTINKVAIHPSLKSKMQHFYSRITNGWSLEKAAYTPVKPQLNRNQLFNGKTLNELSNEFGIPYKTLYYRVHVAKWNIEKAISEPLNKNHGRG